MNLTCPNFTNGEDIPEHFTCTGDDVSPALDIQHIPPGTKTLALTVHDPDSFSGTWWHWIVCDIPIMAHIDEDSIPGRQVINSFGKKDYGGPCPRIGKHRYVFTIYALDTGLGLEGDAEIADLQKAMEGHVLASAELTGRYQKPVPPQRYREITI